MRKITVFVMMAFALLISQLRADEGMWVPMFLKKYNIDDMHKKGLKLSAEDLYSVNNTSLKDAIVIFGGGCTGELISDKGLLITNHHCGFYYVQSHSSIEKDYLTDGFWAMSEGEELACPGLTVTFLVRMEDVSAQVLATVADSMSEGKRQMIIADNIAAISEKAVEGTNYTAVVKPFFGGSEYYLFVNEVYIDVRMVGAPPSAIGKFGGDTDNWMWPRHTGDFSLFRIYAGADNKPAAYSKDNVPYKPKKHLPISLKGVKKDDFTMVYGYPGTTTEYLTSYGVKLISEIENPDQILLREKRLEIMKNYMDASDEVRIQYAAKYASVANYWKKWIGENRGLRKLDAIEKKEALESEFTEWVNADPVRTEKYGALLPTFKILYGDVGPFTLAQDFIYEGAFAVEMIYFSRKMDQYMNNMSSGLKPDEKKEEMENMKKRAAAHFKDYYMPIDKEIFAAMMKTYYQKLDKNWYPDAFKMVETKFKGDFNAWTEYMYTKSNFVSLEKVNQLIDKGDKGLKMIKTDPAYVLFIDFSRLFSGIHFSIVPYENEIERLNRIYIAALREMKADKVFYPDANFTLRITYGKVDDYYPNDGVRYEYYTTLEGIIEKDDPDIYDYRVPEKLKELYKNKDYGRYAENGEIRVCFTGSNHTTGGNSGSPVINDNGELIGVNFDRNWEGTMSDIMYDPDQCRNITLDIRFALFIIDKFAGAGHLVNEMTLVE